MVVGFVRFRSTFGLVLCGKRKLLKTLEPADVDLLTLTEKFILLDHFAPDLLV